MRDQLRRETLETSSMSDREILVEVYDIVAEMNGTVRQHEHDLYGDPAHGTPGLKQQVDSLCDNWAGLKRTAKVAWVMAGLVGAVMLTVLTLLLEHVV